MTGSSHRRRLPLRRDPLSTRRRAARPHALSLRKLPPRRGCSIRRVGHLAHRWIRVRRRRAARIPLVAAYRAQFLRRLRHAGALPQRAPIRSRRHSDCDARRRRAVRSGARNLDRRETRLGSSEYSVAATSAQQQGLTQAKPNGRSSVDTTRSPTALPRRKSSTAPITAVSPRMRLWPRPVVLTMRESGQNRA